VILAIGLPRVGAAGIGLGRAALRWCGRPRPDGCGLRLPGCAMRTGALPSFADALA